MRVDPFSDRNDDAGEGNPVMECRICWYVYDPEMGEEITQTPPGTAFTDLPDDWCCPRCEADKRLFLVSGSEPGQHD